jgi:hypothetical protein
MQTLISTLSSGFGKWCDTALTGATTAPAPTATEPTGNGIIPLIWPGQNPNLQIGPNALELFPFGAGADNATNVLRLWLWDYTGNLWVPQLVGDYTTTLSTCVGVAGKTVIDTDRFADTIVKNYGPSNSIELSPAGATPAINNVMGSILLDVRGYRKAQLCRVSGTATNLNALYRLM